MNNFGSKWLPMVGKVLDSAQQFISYLSDSGWISAFLDKFAKATESIFGKIGVPDFVFMLMAVAEDLPKSIKAAWHGVQKMGEFIERVVVGVYNFFGALGTGIINLFQNGLLNAEDRVNKMIGRVIMSLTSIDWKGFILGTESAVNGALDMAGKFMMSKKTIPDREFTPIKDPSEIFGMMFGDTAIDKFWDKTEKRAQDLRKGFDAFGKMDKGFLMDTDSAQKNR